jgi:hypothetical protein
MPASRRPQHNRGRILMTLRKLVAISALLASLGTALPAFADTAPAVPADANKALWCAAAFTLVEPQARGAGQTAAADSFLGYAKTLNASAGDSLSKAGFTADQIKAQTATYSTKVTQELNGGGTAEFTVLSCTQLVDPAKAAAMQPPAAAPTGKSK